MYINGSIKKYLTDLSAKKPAPGGGSAAALSAAIGVSLMSMVASYTLGNPKYKKVEARAADILKRANNARSKFQKLIDADIEAYDKLSKSAKGAKGQSSRLENLYKKAAGVPLEICRTAADCLKMCEKLAQIGNKKLVTDTAIAAMLLESAFFSAKYNVYVNLKYIKDIDYVGKAYKVLTSLEEGIAKLKEEILEKCEDAI